MAERIMHKINGDKDALFVRQLAQKGSNKGLIKKIKEKNESEKDSYFNAQNASSQNKENSHFKNYKRSGVKQQSKIVDQTPELTDAV
jgi:hypothetical protein